MQPRALAAERASPVAAAALTQAAAALIAALPFVLGLTGGPLLWAALQGAVAVRIATLTHAPLWWLPIHLAFAPALVLAQSVQVPTAAWAAAFVAAALVFGRPWRTRVPLFLAGTGVRDAVQGLLPRGRLFAFVDLGCGLGGVLSGLRRARPEGHFDGVELAPLPYLVARVRGLLRGFWVERRDLMQVDLARYDVVYAFLSPAPMPALWQKARREMRTGTLLVSVAFDVPGIEPDEVIRLSSASRHTLYVYRM